MKIERNKNFNFQPHLHQCFELIILLSGKMKVTVDKNSFNIKKNDAILIFPNQIHSLESTESEHILCIFSPDLVQAFSSKVENKIPINNVFSTDDYLINALINLKTNASTTLKKGLLYTFCGQFEKEAQYCPKTSDTRDFLQKTFMYVEKNFSEKCSLDELAKSIGYDYSYISRTFKKIVGISFNSYVNHYRLSYACYLLENSNTPIVNCAYESGYSSLRTFNRNFKINFGLTPIQYRTSQKHKDS